MTCMLLPGDNPFFNLAAEEYFLKNSEDDFFLVYINKPSVIIGRHQNVFMETNPTFLEKHGILLARRLTGGGAVYHDHGNLNFVFIEKGVFGKLSDRRKYTDIVIDVLKIVGLNAEAGKRNEICIEGKKVSGCAEHIYKNRILHHGTLLFSSDLDNLNRALIPHEGVSGKAVSSVRSEVANISDFIKEKGKTISAFKYDVINVMMQKGICKNMRKLKISETSEINKLEQIKYSTWEWNVAGSPSCRIERNYLFNERNIKVTMFIEAGIINDIAILSDDLPVSLLHDYVNIMKGKRADKILSLESLPIPEDF